MRAEKVNIDAPLLPCVRSFKPFFCLVYCISEKYSRVLQMHSADLLS